IPGGVQEAVLIGGTSADNLDGGDDQDLIFGDNVLLALDPGSGNAIKARFRALVGTIISDANANAQVSNQPGSVPGALPAWSDWTITLDQTLSNFGDDYIAGGGGK